MKTIYLVATGPRAYGSSPVFVAFECKDCADIQAAWYRRGRVLANVFQVELHASLRQAVTGDCQHLAPEPAKRSQFETNHAHTPALLAEGK